MIHTLSVIDPDPVERHRLQSVLSAVAETVAAFENVETFLAQVDALDSEGLVASAALPRLLALLKWLKRRGVALPVIVLDRDTAFRTAVEIMRAGAADFIESGFDDRHLLAAVRKVAHGGTQRANGSAT